ncbi:MAG: T9SS C-terminal target domain-containing protein [Ignavibacteriae bacterium]|nr:MAG: T9SS C-terminal target domain-containing protein [Ignavibacteriota bacterium]
MKKLFPIILSVIIYNNYLIYSQFTDWQVISSEVPFTNIWVFPNSSTMYLNENYVIYKSTNNGINWYSMNKINSFPILYSLFFLNDNTGWVSSPSDIFKTTNGGENWENICPISSSVLLILFLNESTGWCKDLSGSLKKSTNGGENWVQLTNSSGIGKLFFINENTGWDIGLQNIRKTSDGGLTWNEQWSSTFVNLKDIFFVDSLNGCCVGTGGKVIITSNGGVNWTTTNLSNINLLCTYFVNPQTGWVAGDDNKIYKTSDGGINWNTQTSYANIELYDMKMINESTGFVTGGENTDEPGLSKVLYKTTNSGLNWIDIKDGYDGNFTNVFYVNQDIIWITDDKLVLLKSTNGGDSWKDVSFDGNNKQDIYFINENTGWLLEGAVLDKFVVSKTLNGGLNWTTQCTYLDIGPWSIHFADQNYGWATGNDIENHNGYIFKTINGGQNWSYIQIPSIELYSVYFINNATGWIGSDAGKIYKTTDQGNNWIPLNCLTSNNNIRDVLFLNDNTGWVTGYSINSDQTIGNIAKSTNGGASWTIAFTGNLIFYSISVTNNQISAVGWKTLATTPSSIVRSTNNGLNWFFQNTIIPDARLNSVAFINENSGIAVGSMGLILKTTNGGGQPIDVINISKNVPNIFYLEQNYPNPFNPSTNICYTLKLSCYVRLSIFDITGKEVSVIVNQKENAGNYEVEWDGSNFASGIYFYKLETETFSDTKKMILIK